MADEKLIDDDERYVMASPGIMVAHDKSALQQYYRRAAEVHQKQEELNTIKDDVSRLSNEVSDLKSLILDMREMLKSKD